MLIAQVSDIHASPDNDNLQRFYRVLTWLSHLRPDVLVLTGDLTDGHWLEGYLQIASWLKQQPYPTLLLPGNSDDRRQMKAVWGERQWADDAPAGMLNFTHHGAGLRLVGLDSTIDNEDYGSVPGNLGWLETQLCDAADIPSLIFLHHPVFTSGIPSLDKTMCNGLNELTERINRMPGGIMAIASGHVHRPVAGSFAGIPAYICGSVCPANPVWFGTDAVPPVYDPPALMVHRFADNNLTSHHVSV
jgi:3',5'-cyclic AMP phosphodiesterase CpdA